MISSRRRAYDVGRLDDMSEDDLRCPSIVDEANSRSSYSNELSGVLCFSLSSQHVPVLGKNW